MGSIKVELGEVDMDLDIHVGSIGAGDDPRSPRVEEGFELLMRDDSLYG